MGRFLIFQQVEACQTCQSCCQLFSTSACRHGLIRTQTCTYTFVYTHANLFRAHTQNNSIMQQQKYPPTHAAENMHDYRAVNLTWTCLHTRPYISYTSNNSQAVYLTQTCLRFQLHRTRMPILKCHNVSVIWTIFKSLLFFTHMHAHPFLCIWNAVLSPFPHPVFSEVPPTPRLCVNDGIRLTAGTCHSFYWVVESLYQHVLPSALLCLGNKQCVRRAGVVSVCHIPVLGVLTWRERDSDFTCGILGMNVSKPM